jgi:hypothetical protein
MRMAQQILPGHSGSAPIKTFAPRSVPSFPTLPNSKSSLTPLVIFQAKQLKETLLRSALTIPRNIQLLLITKVNRRKTKMPDNKMDRFSRDKINMTMNLKKLCVCMRNTVCGYLPYLLTQQQLKWKLSMD